VLEQVLLASQVRAPVSLTESSSDTIQKLQFGVNTTIELKNITATSDNNACLSVETHPARIHYFQVQLLYFVARS
jgi:hypothetical protein